MKETQFEKDFYCENCGSTTALHIGNLRVIRCMGCDNYYKRGDDWVISLKPPINPNEPPPTRSPCRR